MTLQDTQKTGTVDINHFDFPVNQPNLPAHQASSPIPFTHPRTIDQALPPVKTLERNMLPELLVDWVFDIAERKQVPPDYAAVSALVMIGSLIGAQIGVRPKRYDDWREVLNLWGAIIGPPSALKSPTLADVHKPLRLMEKESEEQYRKELASYEVKQKIRDAQEKVLNKELHQHPENADLLENLLAEPLDKPRRQRYYSNDATTEKIAIILSENPNGILIIRDELVGLLAGWERPGHEQDRAFFLEAFNGTNSFSVDRVGRGSLFVKNACLSVIGTIQPSRLAGYFSDAMHNGNDGALQRFQLAVYPDDKSRPYVDRTPDKESRDKVYNLLEKLAAADYSSWSEKDPYSDEPYVKFDDQAQQFFETWLRVLLNKIRNPDLHPLMQEHLGKFRGLVPKLAAIYHFVDSASEVTKATRISLQNIEKAARFATYLESHANRIYSLFIGQTRQAAYELSRRISNKKTSLTFYRPTDSTEKLAPADRQCDGTGSGRDAG